MSQIQSNPQMNGNMQLDLAPYMQYGTNPMLIVKNLLQYEVFKNLKTGKFYFDVVIFAFIVYLQNGIEKIPIFDRVSQFRNFCFHLLMKMISRRNRDPIKKIIKKVDISYITEGREINLMYEPVLWYLNKHKNPNQEGDESSLEITKTGGGKDMYQFPKGNIAEEVQFKDHILRFTITKQVVTIYADREYKKENNTITLSVEVYDKKSDILREFCELCVKEHAKEQKNVKWEQKIYRNNNEGKWTEKKSKQSRKIETVILKENIKEDLMEDLKSFLIGEEWYVSRDVPYTRRYLFHGKPGTGKSSLIKAIANTSKRHIHYLILSSVKNDEELFKLFESIKFEETVLVIEDIDCVSKITHSRSEEDLKDIEGKEEKSNEPLKGKELVNHEGSAGISDVKKPVKKDSLTLSGLLNAIDGGILDNHGQIMIMTTNKKEVLDEALIRPGRIDKNVCFGFCDTYQVLNLYRNFFDTIPDENIILNKEITPATIISTLLMYKNFPETAWEEMKNLIK